MPENEEPAAQGDGLVGHPVRLARDAAPSWLHGGTSFVVRRIRLELDTWDELDRRAR